MPPKKEEPIMVGEVNVTKYNYLRLMEMTLDLLGTLKVTRQELSRARTVKEAIREGWELTRRRLDRAKAHALNSAHIFQETLHSADDSVKWHMDETKLYDYDMSLKKKLNEYKEMKIDAEEHDIWEKTVLPDLLAAKIQIRESEEYEKEKDIVEREKETQELEEDFEKAKASLLHKSEQRMENWEKRFEVNLELLNLNNRVDRAFGEEYNSILLDALKKQREPEFLRIKDFYRDMAENDLKLLDVMREELDRVSADTAVVKRECDKLSAENKQLVQQRDKLSVTLRRIRLAANNRTKEMSSFKRTVVTVNRNYKEAEDTLADIQSATEVRDNVIKEKEEMRKVLMNSMEESESRKRSLIESWNEKLEACLKELAEKKERVVNKFIEEGLNEEEARRRLCEVLGCEEEAVLEGRSLQFWTAKAMKGHDDLARLLDSRLITAGMTRPECAYTIHNTPPHAHYNPAPFNILEPFMDFRLPACPTDDAPQTHIHVPPQ